MTQLLSSINSANGPPLAASVSKVFVAPELVDGTLERGFEFLQALDDPFQRAVYMMVLVAEVHPFADGNGRIARIMMNAELVARDRRQRPCGACRCRGPGLPGA